MRPTLELQERLLRALEPEKTDERPGGGHPQSGPGSASEPALARPAAAQTRAA